MTVTITDPSNMKITIPRSRKGPTYGLLASALTPLAALFVPAPSFATTGDLTYEGCIANLGANGCEQPAHDSLREAVAVAVSRDDKSVYVGSGGAVTWFKRRSSGALVYKGCISHGRTLGCREDGHGSLNYVEDLAVSRDGKSVYAVAQFGNSITRFKRHRSGALTYKGCFANGGDHGCKEPRHESLGDASGVAMSRDGKSVYVVTFRGSITRFARRSNGALKYRGCIANQRQHECHALPAGSLRFARKVAASPDGSSVYVASYGGIIHFGRAPNGRLAYEGCIANRGARGCQAAVHDTLSAPYGLAISRDGESVYVSSVWDDAITAFRRGPDGTLTYGDCVANESDLGCEAAVHDSLDAAFGIAVSRDGRSVYVVAAGKADSITLFSRESSGP